MFIFLFSSEEIRAQASFGRPSFSSISILRANKIGSSGFGGESHQMTWPENKAIGTAKPHAMATPTKTLFAKNRGYYDSYSSGTLHTQDFIGSFSLVGVLT